MASSPDLVHWGHHIPILSGDVFWETDRVGAGAPPIRTHAGWLEIYHSSGPTARRPSGVGSYCAGAALMDLDNPQKVIGRCSQLLVPETEYERHGFMPDVVFPTGIVSHGDTIHVYYGAADQCTAVTELRLHDVLRAVTE